MTLVRPPLNGPSPSSVDDSLAFLELVDLCLVLVGSSLATAHGLLFSIQMSTGTNVTVASWPAPLLLFCPNGEEFMALVFLGSSSRLALMRLQINENR